MARVDATAAKAAAALAAAQLTTILQDDTLTALANENKHPMGAMRQVEKLFTLDPATGAVTSDDAYIDAAYAGEPLNKGKTPIGLGGTGPALAMAVVSATIEDAAPSDIVLTMNQNVSLAQALYIAGTVTTAKTISSVAIAEAVVTITVSSPYIGTDADIVISSGVIHGTALNQIILDDEAVTNNVV